MIFLDDTRNMKKCDDRDCCSNIPVCQKFCHRHSIELGYNEVAKKYYKVVKGNFIEVAGSEK